MVSKTKLLLEQEVRTVDIPAIIEKFINDAEASKECVDMIQNELKRIKNSPNNMGKLCEYEPLASAGWRKVKLFSSKRLQTTQGATPDLRIIYKYEQENNIVKIHSIGFRIKERPRPAHDPYSRAEIRYVELLGLKD
jgi:hypothetical protein